MYWKQLLVRKKMLTLHYIFYWFVRLWLWVNAETVKLLILCSLSKFEPIKKCISRKWIHLHLFSRISHKLLCISLVFNPAKRLDLHFFLRCVIFIAFLCWEFQMEDGFFYSFIYSIRGGCDEIYCGETVSS